MAESRLTDVGMKKLSQKLRQKIFFYHTQMALGMRGVPKMLTFQETQLRALLGTV